RTTPASATVFGSTTCVCTMPAAGTYRSSRSGLTSNVQPGTPCGRIAGIGIDVVLNPITPSASASAGIPVATERNVDPVHGRLCAVSTLAPPLPAQPAPWATAVAGQVVVSCATATAVRPPAVENSPPASRSPLRRIANAFTHESMPTPSGDQLPVQL